MANQTDETHKERVDRELIELLNELRVALPGVQVLFAFLLTVPFSSGFASLIGSVWPVDAPSGTRPTAAPG